MSEHEKDARKQPGIAEAMTPHERTFPNWDGDHLLATLVVDAPYSPAAHDAETSRTDDSDASGLTPDCAAWDGQT